MEWVGELQDARDWFERQMDLQIVTFCGVVLTNAYVQAR